MPNSKFVRAMVARSEAVSDRFGPPPVRIPVWYRGEPCSSQTAAAWRARLDAFGVVNERINPALARCDDWQPDATLYLSGARQLLVVACSSPFAVPLPALGRLHERVDAPRPDDGILGVIVGGVLGRVAAYIPPTLSLSAVGFRCPMCAGFGFIDPDGPRRCPCCGMVDRSRDARNLVRHFPTVKAA